MTEEEQLSQLLARSRKPYALLDGPYLALDREQVRRTRAIQWIPQESRRRGGKYAYGEWAHVIGIFQALLHCHLPPGAAPRVLDVGCGSGLMAIACQPFVSAGGHYTGLDVSRAQIDFCRHYYPHEGYEFLHLDVVNPFYSPQQAAAHAAWPLADGAMDVLTAVSVWTHFREADARYYFAELARVLRPGGRALVTVFLLDEDYRNSLPARTGAPSEFHATERRRWIFDQPDGAPGGWWYPAWAEVPEQAVGITREALDDLMQGAGMRLLRLYPGNWKERPGVFFQDVLVMEKCDDTAA